MIRGGEQTPAQGFTVVETLIVLAVTTALFLLVAAYTNGRQNRTEFTVGVRDIKQKFEQLANETKSGYYKNTNNFSCTKGATAPLSIAPGAIEQGKNSDCIFIGKVFVAGESRQTDMHIFSLAGARESAGDDVQLLTDAWPTAIAPAITKNTTAPADAVETYKYPAGIRLQKVTKYVSATPNTSQTVVALISSLAYGTSSDMGSQTFSLKGFSGSIAAATPEEEAENINNESLWSQNVDKVVYCFVSGGTDQLGLITLSDAGVTLDIKMTTACP